MATLVVVLCALALLLYNRRSMTRHAQNVFVAVYYHLDPSMMGRSHVAFPSPSCCTGQGCVPKRAQRTAVLSLVSSAAYLPLFLQLECTLRKSNPGTALAAMVEHGVLGSAGERRLRSLDVTIIRPPPLEFRNTYEPRYGKNWVKLAAFNQTQYDVVLLVDADTVVVGDLTPLWTIPAPFAAVWDQSRWLGRYRTVLTGFNGGVLLLRPCAAVAAHMRSIVDSNPKLRFTHGTAEQDFLAWYYRFTGVTLPIEYNVQGTRQTEQSLVGNLTVGGMRPVILHFSTFKPWDGPEPGKLGHEFLCSAKALRRRSVATGMDP